MDRNPVTLPEIPSEHLDVKGLSPGSQIVLDIVAAEQFRTIAGLYRDIVECPGVCKLE